MVAIFTGLGAGFERGSVAALGSAGLLGAGSLGRGNENVAVNAATGGLILSRQDQYLIGKGPDPSVSRTYNSLGTLDENGDYWRQSTDRRVYGLTGTMGAANSTIKRVSADGSEITFKFLQQSGQDSIYETTDGAGAYDRLTYNSGTGKWTWSDGDTDISELYDLVTTGNWRIKSQSDGDANTVTFGYASATGPLTTITAADGGYLKYTWNTANTHIEKVELFATSAAAYSYSSTMYEYDGSDRLERVKVDLTLGDTSSVQTYDTWYTYDGTSRRIASIKQSDNSVLNVTYWTSGAYAGWVKDLTLIVDPLDLTKNRVTAFAYADDGPGILRTDVTDPRGQVTKLWSKSTDNGATATDERGQLIRVMAPAPNASTSATEINYTYDANGNVLTAITKSGTATLSTVSYQYDAPTGNLTQVTDANGNITTRTYDSKNHVSLETRTGSYTGGSGTLYTRFVYDSEEHLVYLISAEGHVTEYRYTPGGELEYTIEYPAHAYTIGSTVPTQATMDTWRNGLTDRSTAKIVKSVYDPRGNLTETTRYGSATTAGVGLTTEGTSTTYVAYDPSGRLLSKYTSAGSLSVAETYGYDGLGRVTVWTDGAGGRNKVVFGDAATTTTITTQTTSGDVETGQSYIVVSTYNKAGELTKVVNTGSATGGNYTAGGTAIYDYDKDGQLRLATDATGLRHFYLYDKARRKVADIYADSSLTATGEIVEYKYDTFGRVIGTIHYNNKLTTLQLAMLVDPAGEVLIEEIRPATHNYDTWEWTIYDAGGRVIETILGDGSVTGYDYDASNRLVKIRGYVNKLAAGTVSGYLANPPTTVVWPTADSNGKDTVTRTFYDRDGRVVGALDAEGYVSKIVYDEAGQKIQEITYVNKTTSLNPATDTFDQLLTAVTLDAARDVSKRYVYDGQGLLRYTIDGINRVTETVYFTATASMAVGLVRKTVAYATALGAVANYTYSTVKAAVASLASAPNDRTFWSVYNDRGQLKYAISQVSSDLVSGVLHPFATVVRYDYDAAGLVIKKTEYATTVDMFGVAVDTPAAVDALVSGIGANARITRNYYAERGELRFSVDAEGYVDQFGYDLEGRLRYTYRWSDRVVVSDTTLIAAVHGAAKGTSVSTDTRYDASGRMVDFYDANGIRHYFGYYATGKRAWEIHSYAQGTDENRKLYIYDHGGRLQQERLYTSDVGNASAVGAATTTQLNTSYRITSPNGQYNAILTREGELRIYKNGEAIWSNGVREVVAGATYRLVAQTDGKLTIYRDVASLPSVAIWERTSSSTGATYLSMEDNGNLTFRKGTPTGDLGELWTSASSSLVASAYAAEFVSTSYTYDGLGNVTYVNDPKGQTTANTYDKVGRLLTTWKNGVQTSYQYDAFGHGVKITDPNGNASYSYYDQAGRVFLTVDAENYAVRTTYNAFGEVVNVRRYAAKATGTGSLTTLPVTTDDANADAITTFVYDKLGRLLSKTDPVGAIESYTYNTFGNVLTATSKLSAVTTFTYDKLGRLTQEQRPLGIINKYTYDARSNRLQMIEAFGLAEQRTTNYEYDPGDRLVRTSHDSITVTTSTGTAVVTPEERYIYDRRGNVIESIDTAGARTLFWYNKQNQIIAQLNATGTLTRLFYDKNGNVAERQTYDTLVSLPADAKGLPPTGSGSYRVTLYTYDPLNRLLETRTPSISVATINSAGVLTSALQDLVTANTYDGAGNIVKTLDPRGKATWFYYDKVGNLTTTIDAENYRVDRTYDADGNVLAERRYFAASVAPTVPTPLPPTAPAVSAARDQYTTFTYDKAGRLVETRTPSVSTASISGGVLNVVTQDLVTTREYDAAGNVLKLIENGQETTFTYDTLNRVLTSTKATAQTQYIYDAFGHDVKTIDALGNASYTYFDKLGRVVLTVDAENYAVATTYNAQGEIATVKRYAVKATNVGSLTVLPTLTANGADAVTTFAYDLAGRLTSTADALGVAELYAYNAHGERASITNRLGGVTTSTYDKAGRVTEEQLPVGSYDAAGTLIAANIVNTLAYDAAGNRVRVTEASNIANDQRITNFEYDGVGRLTRTYGPTVTVFASSLDGASSVAPQGRTIYDLHGEIIETIDAVGARTLFWYDKAGQLTHQLSAMGTLTQFFYDKNGNTVETRIYETPVSLPPNATDTPPVGGATFRVTRYAYDGLNRLTQTRIPTADTAVYSGSALTIATVDLVTTTVYDKLGNVLQTTDPNGKVAWFYYDKTGHKTAQVDAENYRTSWTYDADGNVLSEIRYANAGAAPTGTTSPPSTPTVSADDRATIFTYDKMGRRLTETRLGVKVHDGLGGEVSWNSTITYTYNALGQVLSKSEAPALPSVIAWWNNNTGRNVIATYGQTAQGESALFLRQTIPFSDPAWTSWQYGGTVLVMGGDRPDGFYSIQGGQTIKYSFETKEISDTAMRTDAVLVFWDSSWNFLGYGGQSWTEADSQFTLAQGIATAPANAAYASVEIQLTRLNTTNTGPMEIAIRNVNIDNSGGPTLVSSWGDMQITPGQTPQGENTLLVRKQTPMTDPGWPTSQYGGAVRVTGGDRADGLFSVKAGQTVGYSFDMKEISDNALRADAALEFWDANGVFLGPVGWTSTEGSDLFSTVTGSAVAPANAAYATLEIWVLRLNTTNSAPIEMGLRNIQIDTRGVGSLGKTAGETVKYAYDLGGRLVTEARSSFKDVNNQWVTPTIDYFYNGLSNISRMRQRGAGGAIAAAERVTTYTYMTDKTGRLESVRNANYDSLTPTLHVRTYRYDAAGRVVREEYTRAKPTGTSYEAVGTDYDLEGRVTKTGAVVVNQTTLLGDRTGLDVANTQYNAFGEVSARGINNVFAETFAYDGAGRMWRTTSGDGTWKYFMYDKAGNQTLAIASDGLNISNQSMAWVLGRWTTQADIISTNGNGVVATLTRYDGRNMAVEAFEPQRELSYLTAQNFQTFRAYNAFGEISYEINALGARIDYTYNTMGRLTKRESPAVEGVGENGLWITGYDAAGAPTATSTTAVTFRPVEKSYYDLAGRLVATRDANGRLTRMAVLSGTGLGGTEAQIVRTTTADGASVTTDYDIFGDARKITDQIGRQTTQTFDKTGRLVQLNRPGGLIEYFVYDDLGQVIRRYNNQLGITYAETNAYDAQGRLIQQVAAGGDTTSFSYTWSASLATSGMGTYGGWTQVTTYQNTKTLTEVGDQFSRAISKTDLGANFSSYSYDWAGRVTLQTGGTDLTYTYLNTGRVDKMETLAGTIASQSYVQNIQRYSYDKVGNVSAQSVVETAQYYPGSGVVTNVYSNATATYDALGRMLTWVEAGSTLQPAASTTYVYDANGNIRRFTSNFKTWTGTGGTTGSFSNAGTTDYWYRFDALNRVVTRNGVLENGAIVRGANGQGIDYLYDLAGQRASSLVTFQDTEAFTILDVTNYYNFTNERRENFYYDDAGRVTRVDAGSGTYFAPFAQVGQVGAYTYDLLGRVVQQTDYTAGTVAFSRAVTYNAKGQVTTETTDTRRNSSNLIARAVITNDYGTGTSYALGSVLTVTTTNSESVNNGAFVPKTTSTLTNAYQWRDGAVQSSISYKPDVNAAAQLSTYTYTTAGGVARLSQVSIADGRPRTVYYRTDMTGQIYQRREQDGNASQQDPQEIWYRFAGKQMGMIGNNSTSDVDYITSVATRQMVPEQSGAFRGGRTTALPYANFDQSLGQINSFTQGGSGSYTAREGETLASIAANMWGDSSLWYKLAEANGLSAEASLREGQIITVPAGVMKSQHNASTFKPYDSAEAIGETGPFTPKQPKKNKCGVFGQILLAVISTAVTSFLGPLIGWIPAGAVGSATSQYIGVQTGIQQKFSWTQVAASALSAGLDQGMTANLMAGGNPIAAAANALTNNAISQAASIALGPQKKFDWAGFASAGVSAGVTAWVGSQMESWGLGKMGDLKIDPTPAEIGRHLFVGSAGAIASSAARSLISGTDFELEFRNALPGVIGGTIGEFIAGRIEMANMRSAVPGSEGRSDADVRSAYAFAGRMDEYTGNAPGTALANARKSEVNKDLLWTSEDVRRATTIEDQTALIDKFENEHPGVLPQPTGASGGDGQTDRVVITGTRYPFNTLDLSKETFVRVGGARPDGVDLAVGGVADDIVSAIEQNRAVERKSPALGIQALDDITMAGGNSMLWIAEKMDKEWWVGFAAEALSIASGPASYAAGEITRPIVGPLSEQVTVPAAEAIATKFLEAGYDEKSAQAGAAGSLGIGEMVVGIAIAGGVRKGVKMFAEHQPRVVAKVKSLFGAFRTKMAAALNKVAPVKKVPRIFKSIDKYVGETATYLDKQFTGRVIDVNVNMPLKNGAFREVDVLMDQFVIQVKSGNAGSLIGQMEKTKSTLLDQSKMVLGYAPEMPQAAWAQAARNGIPIARSMDELAAMVKEFSR